MIRFIPILFISMLLSGNCVAQSKMLHFYPNPAFASINVDFQKGNNNRYSLLIYNLMGKKVIEMKNLSYKTTITLGEFYRGIYIYQLRDKNNQIIESGKFQVAK